MLGTPHTSDFYFVRSFSCIEKTPNTLETVQGRITTCSADKWGSSSGGSTPASRSATRAPRRHETSRLGRHEDRCSLSLPCPGRMRTDKASSASTCMGVWRTWHILTSCCSCYFGMRAPCTTQTRTLIFGRPKATQGHVPRSHRPMKAAHV